MTEAYFALLRANLPELGELSLAGWLLGIYGFTAGAMWASCKLDGYGWYSLLSLLWPLWLLWGVADWFWNKTWSFGSYGWRIPLSRTHFLVVKNLGEILRYPPNHGSRQDWIYLPRWEYLGFGLWKSREVYGWVVPNGAGGYKKACEDEE